MAFHEWNTPNFVDLLSESRVKIVDVESGKIDTLCTLNIASTQPMGLDWRLHILDSRYK